jgi:hypothetical protein
MQQVDISSITLIGIHGPLNGGKDTTANYIQAKFPGKFGRYAFAAPLKRACKEMFNFTDEQLEDQALKKEVDSFWGFSPRFAMQKLGTEYGRGMLRDDIWIKRAEMEFHLNHKSAKGTIITDVRFENEGEWVRSQPGAILIYLKVPGLKKDEQYQHASEAGITQMSTDYEIVNDKGQGVLTLHRQIDAIFS